MKNTLIKFGLLVSLLVVQASGLFAQSDSSSKILNDCVAHLIQIHSGSLRYTIASNSIYKLAMKTDTAIFSFDALGDTANELFVLDRGNNLMLYDGKNFLFIDRRHESYTRTALNGKEALDKIGSDLPGPIANRGEAMSNYVHDKEDKLSSRDSTVLGKTCIVLEVRKHEEGGIENPEKHLDVKYFLTADHEVLGYRYDLEAVGRPVAQEVHILHSQYNSTNRKELEKLIAMTEDHLSTFKKDSTSILAQTRNPQDDLLPMGTRAPDFAAVTVEGDTVDLYAVHGKVILLDFWFAACMPCRRFTPFLISMEAKYRSKGLVILGVNPYDHVASLVKDASHSMKVNFPEMMLPAIYQAEYGISVYPTVYLLDSEKSVVHTQMGYSTSREEELEKAIQKALQ